VDKELAPVVQELSQQLMAGNPIGFRFHGFVSLLASDAGLRGHLRRPEF
jgi:hypothetical protein